MRSHAFNPDALIIVSEHFYPSSGATAQLIKNLADYLHHSGLPLVILTSTPGDSSGPYPIYRFCSTSSNSSSILSKLFNGISFFAGALNWLLINSRSTNTLFIVSNPPFIGVLGLIINYIKRSHYLFLLQDLFPRSATLTGILPSRGPLPLFWKIITKIVLTNSASTIVLSESMKRRCQVEYDVVSNLHVIHNWPVFADPGPLNIITEEHSTLVIQYSGNFGRLHDILTLLEAARLLKDEPIQFVFIGGGAKYEQITRYKEEYQMLNIEVYPYISIEELPQSIASCDISVVSLIPGAEDTVAPSKLYGILASSRPVLLIASEDCELARSVKLSGSGFVFNPGDSLSIADKLKFLLHHKSHIALAGSNAYLLYLNQYRPEHSLNQYSTLIRQTS